MIHLKKLFLLVLAFGLLVDDSVSWRRRRRRRRTPPPPPPPRPQAPSLPNDSWVNKWDQKFAVHCRRGQSISRLRSIHSNLHEDRVWAFSCHRNRYVSQTRCYWSHYNAWDSRVHQVCHYGGFIAGVHSYHDNGKEDRKYSFKCCNRKNRVRISDCHWTGYQNNWDRELHYYVPRYYYLRGIESYHRNDKEDRRWKFYICRKASGGKK